MSRSLLEITKVTKTYPIHRQNGSWWGKKERMCAVDHLSLVIETGETYGLVGESGCGKTTTGRMITGLTKADSGSILYEGKNLCNLSEREYRPLRSDIQMVFQNTLSALNPRIRVENFLEEILVVHGEHDPVKRREKALEILEKVGLSEEHYFRYPHELSGGQIQRLGIAGALIVHPKLIVCDEPVSVLDVSIQAQILNLLVRLKKEMRLSLLFISHDIGVVRFIADRIGVMYLGTLVEESGTDQLFECQMHPYTKTLFAAVPDPYIESDGLKGLTGEQTLKTEEFKGCAFFNRCPAAMQICREEAPMLREVKPGHKVACHCVAD